MKVFFYTWLNFIWMFAAMGPIIGPTERSIQEWLIRGTVGGFFSGLAFVAIQRWQRQRKLQKALLNEEL